VSGSTFKLVILFKPPESPAVFEQRWSEEFVPLAEQLPGLRRVVVAHTHGGPAGPVEVYLIHELHFDSQAALGAAMTSAEGVAAGQCLVRVAGKNATLMFAEHMEDRPHGADHNEGTKEEL
jgi:uncharacterized protein (TIGR02118 family)